MSILTITVPADSTEQVTMAPTDGSLDTLQAAVGGWVECVGEETYSICLDEEGKIKNKPVNQRATKLAHRLKVIQFTDVIVGDAVVTGFDLNSGENADAPAWMLVYLAEASE